MTAWLVATIALLPPLSAMIIMCGRGQIGHRLVAAQCATSVAALILGCMSFAFDQASSIDLALTLGFLSLPATLLFAVFAERWL